MIWATLVANEAAMKEAPTAKPLAIITALVPNIDSNGDARGPAAGQRKKQFGFVNRWIAHGVIGHHMIYTMKK